MALTQHLSEKIGSDTAHRRCSTIRDSLIRAGLFAASQADEPATASLPQRQGMVPQWRIAPAPFPLSHEQVSFFHALGTDLLAFYRALNRLYQESVRGTQPAWVAAYLDQGKPESLVTFSRMRRFKDLLPAVIRPDVIPTADGLVITELDSVPGGIGLTACMAQVYGQWEDKGALTAPSAHCPSPIAHRLFEIVGGRDGMVRGFSAMLRAQQGTSPGCVAIIVSDEAKDYRPEMTWLAARLRESGTEAYCVEPRDVRFIEEGLFLSTDTGEWPVGLIYRFFELFDLKNIPKAELVLYSTKKSHVVVTPPYKPALEEKLTFALLHHPVLRPFWLRELGEAMFANLSTLIPRTWILDPRPVPPTATIPGLELGGRPVTDWRELARATQKERHYVIKPSGFSELAWGSRGVSVGHDLPQTEWTAAIEHALASFPTTPFILQEFHKGKVYEMTYLEPATNEVASMSGRVRLSPYYFVTGEQAELAGILATVCPSDKKVIHGMKDAIMVPCAVQMQN